jgi:hypothetical protein
MITLSRSFKLIALAIIAVPALATAQGSLSVQGFGYPSGQLSTRALGTGGAVGEMDPLSVTNPSVLSSLGGSVLYFQIEPEYRRLHSGNSTESATIARYPLIVAAFPLRDKIMIGLSASNLLDRSFETTVRGSTIAGDTTVSSTNSFKSDGAIGDLRVAASYIPVKWLKLGLAAHAIAGDNRVRNSQIFDDSVRYKALIDTATIGYTGNAYSTGFELLLGTEVSIAGSYRKGGSLSLKRGDTTITKANVPDRFAISAAYIGIRGTAISVRTAKETWTRMQTLGTPSLRISDGWDTSIGADVLGPKLGSNNFNLRTGARWRTLPFGLSTSDVKEKTYSLGAGTTLGRGGRAAIDIATFRSSRSASSTLSETAWTLSVGLTVRP